MARALPFVVLLALTFVVVALVGPLASYRRREPPLVPGARVTIEQRNGRTIEGFIVSAAPQAEVIVIADLAGRQVRLARSDIRAIGPVPAAPVARAAEADRRAPGTPAARSPSDVELPTLGTSTTGLTIPAGTVLSVQLTGNVGAHDKMTDPIHARLRRDILVGDTTVIPKGTLLLGRIVSVPKRPRGLKSDLAFWRRRGAPPVVVQFHTLKLNDTTADSYPIQTAVVGRRGARRSWAASIPIAAGAAGGAIVAGGVGAVAGGAAGTMLVTALSRGVQLRRGSIMPVTLIKPLTLPPSSQRNAGAEAPLPRSVAKASPKSR